MSNSITRRLENEEVSTCLSLPDASELDTTVTDDSSDSARKTLSSLPDADQVNDSYLESDSGITTLHYQEGNDRSYFSDTNDSEYHESSPNTPTPSHHEVTDQPWLSGAGEVGNSRNFDSDASALTPGNHHVIDQYSFLSDAPDAENSELLTPDHQQVINQSYLPDASYVSDTTIKMESPDKSVPGHGSSVPDVSGVDNSGRLTESSAHSEGVEHNNLFFLQDDGTVLAIHIKSSSGPELLRVLRGLSQQIGPLTQLAALPFDLAASNTIDDNLANHAQELSLTGSASAPPRSSTTVPSRKAPISINKLAPVLGTSAALSSMSSSSSSTGTFNTDTWIDGIFSSTDGKPYERDWISKYKVNEDILKGAPSKHKLDLLVRHGAVVIGDKLCVTYHSSGHPVVIEGEVLPGSTSTNLCVRIAAGTDGILRSVQGPKDLISGMNKTYAPRYDHAVPGGWKEVRLTSSSGHDFGTLFDVRQAYQVWADQKAKWVARNSRAAV